MKRNKKKSLTKNIPIVKKSIDLKGISTPQHTKNLLSFDSNNLNCITEN